MNLPKPDLQERLVVRSEEQRRHGLLEKPSILINKF
jgi:hypothetical protein